MRDLPPYSTDLLAADRLIDLLEKRRRLRCIFEQAEGVWYCVCWSMEKGQPKERIATGSGPDRAVAFCRAMVNLPRGLSASEHSRRTKANGARACDQCGSEDRMRGRAFAVRLCNVCAWRAGKLGLRDRDLR